MTVSLRTRRVTLYRYVRSTTNGVVSHTYQQVRSVAPDGQWWASRGVPTGREALVAAQAEFTADTVFGFDAAAPVGDGALITDGGIDYKVTAVLPRDLAGGELQVLAVRSSDATYTKVAS
jgi:hypothetical protein